MHGFSCPYLFIFSKKSFLFSGLLLQEPLVANDVHLFFKGQITQFFKQFTHLQFLEELRPGLDKLKVISNTKPK
jgi:hypothetical protein